MKPTHKCPKCDKVGPVTFERWNFKCDCGYKTHLFMRREMMPVDEKERELMLEIAGQCLMT